jgi:hypothetical protein
MVVIVERSLNYYRPTIENTVMDPFHPRGGSDCHSYQSNLSVRHGRDNVLIAVHIFYLRRERVGVAEIDGERYPLYRPIPKRSSIG